MSLKTLSAKAAAELDQELMSPAGGYTIDQLMELAGLACSQAVYRVHPPSQGRRVLVAAGPGNNGGDGLVLARHLLHYRYAPTVFYPKPTNAPIFRNLQTQLAGLGVPVLAELEAFSAALADADLVVDAVFGFSFRPPVRAPFDAVMRAVIASGKPVLSVDVPSTWDVEGGPPSKDAPESDRLGCDFMPQYLVSLTAAKPCVRFFRGRHFIGGRFLGRDLAARYGIEVPPYEGYEQIVEVPIPDAGKL